MGILTGRWVLSKKDTLSEEEFKVWQNKWASIARALRIIAIIVLVVGFVVVGAGNGNSHYEAKERWTPETGTMVFFVEVFEPGSPVWLIIGGLLLLYSIGLKIGMAIPFTSAEEKKMDRAARKYIHETHGKVSFSCQHCYKTIETNLKEQWGPRTCPHCHETNALWHILDEVIKEEGLLTDPAKRVLIKPYIEEK